MKKQSRKEKPKGSRSAVEPSVRDPESETDSVLLAVTGMSPAVLTETIWAIAEQTPRAMPKRVVVLTTTEGKEALDRDLFGTPIGGFDNVWQAMRHSLESRGIRRADLPSIDRTNDVRIFTIRDDKTGEAQPLNDIRSAKHQEATADTVLETVRSLVENEHLQVIASVAGGRKTMGVLLYAALSLIGREGDRLTHVLVSEPFDNSRLNPKFFYPEQPTGLLRLPGAGTFDPHDATLDLAEIPFVPLREVFPRELGSRPGSFMAMVRRYQQSTSMVTVEDLRLVIHKSTPEIEINGLTIVASPRECVIMHFLARHCVAGRQPFGTYAFARDEVLAHARELIAEASKEDFSDWRHSLKAFVRSEDPDRQITKNLDSLRSKLRKRGGDATRLIQALPTKGRFSLKLPPDQVRIVD